MHSSKTISSKPSQDVLPIMFRDGFIFRNSCKEGYSHLFLDGKIKQSEYGIISMLIVRIASAEFHV